MIIPPARGNRGMRATARSASVGAPVGGWNARDPLDGMKATDAVVLDNFFPSTENVKLRLGFGAFATGLGDGAVESLIPYASGNTVKMLGFCDGDAFECGSSGAVGSALATGLSNDRWQGVNFKGYAVFVNGADTPRKYDGSTVSTTSITGSGLTATTLCRPWIFKERIFFIESGTLSAWYLGTGAISGTAAELDFSGFCRLGGQLVAGGTWTRDGGNGMDDLCVFLTDKGEALVYQGTDPSSASTWALVGVFRLPEPVGDKPLVNIGPELVAITSTGFLPLSSALRDGGGKAVSDRIRNAVNVATRSFGSLYGWQGVHYPAGGMLIFNVPQAAAASHQYVMNTITGAWCRFTGMNARCWAVHDGSLYFGGGAGKVFAADSGRDDDGAEIIGTVAPAFSYFGSRGRQKRFTAARPNLTTDADVTVSYRLNTDFRIRAPEAVFTVNTGGSLWDEEFWDQAYWAGEATVQNQWLSLSGTGYNASLAMRVSTVSVQVELNSTDYVFEPGGVL